MLRESLRIVLGNVLYDPQYFFSWYVVDREHCSRDEQEQDVEYEFVNFQLNLLLFEINLTFQSLGGLDTHTGAGISFRRGNTRGFGWGCHTSLDRGGGLCSAPPSFLL